VVTDYRDENEFVHGFTWTRRVRHARLRKKHDRPACQNQRSDIGGIYFDAPRNSRGLFFWTLSFGKFNYYSASTEDNQLGGCLESDPC
jgi:hypothetical protein